MTGEEVTYTYDAVQRLVAAETTADAQSGGWGTSYGYDGFGNLWSKTTTKGSAPGLSVTYDRTTNRQYGVSYDANGNPSTVNGVAATWDVENRLGGWTYDPWNRRVEQTWTDGEFQMYGFNLYTPGGQLAVTVNCQQYLVPLLLHRRRAVRIHRGEAGNDGLVVVGDDGGDGPAGVGAGEHGEWLPAGDVLPLRRSECQPAAGRKLRIRDVPAGRAGAGLCDEPVLLGDVGEVL